MSTVIDQGIAFDDFSAGVIDDVAVASSLIPKNAVRKAVNFLFDRPRGALTVRSGTTSVGTGAVASTKTCLGLFNHRSSTAANSQLLSAFNGVIYYFNGTTWTSTVPGLSTSAKVRFLTYLDFVLFMNGVDSSQAWSGTSSWVTSGGNLDVGNMPLLSSAVVFNGRLFGIGNPTNPSTVYKSSIVSGGSISWTSGNGTVLVKPQDGAGGLTAMTSTGSSLLLWKERAMYRYDDNSLVFICPIGCPTQEAVATDDQGTVYFFGQAGSSVGIYATQGGYAKKISRPIQKWIEAIAASSYGNIASYATENKIVWSVGSCTVDGTVYAATELVWNVSDQTWEVYNYLDSFRVFSPYITSAGVYTVVGGDTDGFVQTMNSGNTDGIVGSTAGTPIFYEVDFSPTVLTGRHRTKNVHEIVTFATNPNGANFYMSADDKPTKFLGSVQKREESFKDSTVGSVLVSGQMIFPRLVGVSDGPAMTFEGYNFTRIVDEGVGV